MIQKKVLCMAIVLGCVVLVMLFLSCGIAAASVPQRIIVLPFFAEEILLSMIGPDRIIGIGHEYLDNGEAISPTMPLTRQIDAVY